MSDFDTFTHNVANELRNPTSQEIGDVTDALINMFSTKGYINYLIASFRQGNEEVYQKFLYTLIKRFFNITKAEIADCCEGSIEDLQAQVLDLFDGDPKYHGLVVDIIGTMIQFQWPQVWPNFIASILPALDISIEMATDLLSLIGRVPLCGSDAPLGETGDALPNYIFHMLFDAVPTWELNSKADRFVASCFKALQAILSCHFSRSKITLQDYSPILIVGNNVIKTPQFTHSLKALSNLLSSHLYLIAQDFKANPGNQDLLIELFDSVLLRLTNCSSFSLPTAPSSQTFSNSPNSPSRFGNLQNLTGSQSSQIAPSSQNSQNPVFGNGQMLDENGEPIEVMSDETFGVLCVILQLGTQDFNTFDPTIEQNQSQNQSENQNESQNSEIEENPPFFYFSNEERCVHFTQNLLIPYLNFSPKDRQLFAENPIEFFERTCSGKNRWFFGTREQVSRKAAVGNVFHNLAWRQWFIDNIPALVQELLETGCLVSALGVLSSNVISTNTDLARELLLSALQSDSGNPAEQGLAQCAALSCLSNSVGTTSLDELHRAAVPIAMGLINLPEPSAVSLHAIRYIKKICLSQNFEAEFFEAMNPSEFGPKLLTLVDDDLLVLPIAAKTVLSLLVATKSTALASGAAEFASEQIQDILSHETKNLNSGANFNSDANFSSDANFNSDANPNANADANSGNIAPDKTPKLMTTFFNIVGLAAILGAPEQACSLATGILTEHIDYASYGLQMALAVANYVNGLAAHKSLPELFSGNFPAAAEVLQQYNEAKRETKLLNEGNPGYTEKNWEERIGNVQQIFEANPGVHEMLMGVFHMMQNQEIWDFNNTPALIDLLGAFAKIVPQIVLEQFDTFLAIIQGEIEKNKTLNASVIALSLVKNLTFFNKEIVNPILEIFSAFYNNNSNPNNSNANSSNPFFPPPGILNNYLFSSRETSELMLEIARIVGFDVMLQRFPLKVVQNSLTGFSADPSNVAEIYFEAIEKVPLEDWQLCSVLNQMLNWSMSPFRVRYGNNWHRNHYVGLGDVDGGVRYYQLQYCTPKGVLSRISRSFRIHPRFRSQNRMRNQNQNQNQNQTPEQIEEEKKMAMLQQIEDEKQAAIAKRVAEVIKAFSDSHPGYLDEVYLAKNPWNMTRLQKIAEKTGISFGLPPLPPPETPAIGGNKVWMVPRSQPNH